MSLLPPLFRRGDRLRPLGTPSRPEPAAKPAEQPVHDWRFATPADGAPRQVRLHLADWAEAEAEVFRRSYADRGCDCFTGCAPCSWCMHPGNPLNLAEDDAAWVMGHADAISGSAS